MLNRKLNIKGIFKVNVWFFYIEMAKLFDEV